MRTYASIATLFLSSTICCLLVLKPHSAFAGDPLMDRDGRTLTVKIDGAETTRTKERKLTDVAGIQAFETFWSHKIKEGAHCFAIQTHDKRLGEVERIDMLIHEIHNERPHQRWKSYESVPSTTEGMQDFLTPKGFCPQEYKLTDRLKFPTLPAGEYVLRIAYWGKGNWDRQDIYLTIEK